MMKLKKKQINFFAFGGATIKYGSCKVDGCDRDLSKIQNLKKNG